MTTVIECRGVAKAYAGRTVVDQVDLDVVEGEIFGVIGPNGAGKTTLLECVEGLRRPDSGTISVLGLDPQRDAATLRTRVGVQLQSAALPSRITVREAVSLFAAFYPRPAGWRTLIDELGLTEHQGTYVEKLSGGQRQRVFIALALVNDPEVVFLDELTTGLDPATRRQTWELVRRVRDRGCTVVLTTHDMAEAEHLCDRVAVVDQGRVVALDTVPALVAGLGSGAWVSFLDDVAAPVSALEALTSVDQVQRAGGRVTAHGTGTVVQDVVGALTAAGFIADDLRTGRAGLEDVFFARTGRRIQEGGEAA